MSTPLKSSAHRWECLSGFQRESSASPTPRSIRPRRWCLKLRMERRDRLARTGSHFHETGRRTSSRSGEIDSLFAEQLPPPALTIQYAARAVSNVLAERSKVVLPRKVAFHSKVELAELAQRQSGFVANNSHSRAPGSGSPSERRIAKTLR